MASDGKVVIGTELDTGGAINDSAKLGNELNKNIKQQVAKAAAEYRKQGMSASEAWKKAWSEIERTSSQGSKNVSKSLSSTSIDINAITSSLRRVAGLLLTAFSARQLLNVGKQAVEMASDLQEVQNVVDTAFGDMSYKMEQFADTAIDNFGISRLEAKRTGSTFMAMASGMGLAMDSASDMAIALTGLSADMASFYNVSQDVASTALKSIFTGETETLKQFGIVMTEVNLQEFAYQQGINKKIQAMTQAEKVQLRYSYVMSQTALAQGDFAKTSNSWANQTRILQERWKEFLTIMGNGLVQVLTPALQLLNSMLAKLIDIGNALAKTFGFDIAQSATSASSSISDISDNIDDVTESTKDAKKAQDNLTGSYDKLNVIQKESSDATDTAGISNTPTVPSGLSTTTSKVPNSTTDLSKSNTALSALKAILEPLSKISLANLSTSLGNLKTVLGTLGDNIGSGLKWFYDNVLVPLAQWTIEDVLPAFINLLAGALAVLNTAIEVAKPVLQWLWDNFLEPIAKFVGAVFINFIENLAKDLQLLAQNKGAVAALEALAAAILVYKAGGAVMTALKGLTTSLNELGVAGQAVAVAGAAIAGWEIGTTLYESLSGEEAGSFGEQMSYLFDASFDEIADGWNAMWADSFAALKELWDLLVEWLGDNIVQPIVDLFVGIWNSIKEVFKTVASWFKSVFSKAVAGIKAAFNGIKTFFSTIWNGIKSVFKTVASWFKLIFGKAVAGIKAVFNGIKTFFSNVWTGIKNVFKTVASWFKSVFNTAWTAIKTVFSLNTIKSFFSSVINGIKNVFSGIVNWFKSIFGNGWTGIKSAFSLNTIKTFFTSILTAIKNVFTAIPEWFKTKFSSAWDAIKNVFSVVGKIGKGIVDGVANVFKGLVNLLIDGINAVIAAPFKTINGLLNKIRSTEILGFTPFDGLWSKNPLPIPQIPKLATGAVLPANKPFMAVVGDQRHGTNVEAPLDTIKQALIEALASAPIGSPQTINLNLAGKTVAQVVWDEQLKYYKQTGKRSPV